MVIELRQFCEFCGSNLIIYKEKERLFIKCPFCGHEISNLDLNFEENLFYKELNLL